MKRKLVFLATIISTLTIFTANTNSVYAVDSTGVSISAKQNQLTEGWNINSDGSISYVKNGSKVTGKKKIFRNKYLMENLVVDENYDRNSSFDWYFFDTKGNMKTGWIKDGGRSYFLYSNGKMAREAYIDGWYVGENGALIPGKVNNSYSSGSNNWGSYKSKDTEDGYLALRLYKSKDDIEDYYDNPYYDNRNSSLYGKFKLEGSVITEKQFSELLKSGHIGVEVNNSLRAKSGKTISNLCFYYKE